MNLVVDTVPCPIEIHWTKKTTKYLKKTLFPKFLGGKYQIYVFSGKLGGPNLNLMVVNF
jgi:hypothetical protein